MAPNGVAPLRHAAVMCVAPTARSSSATAFTSAKTRSPFLRPSASIALRVTIAGTSRLYQRFQLLICSNIIA
jgi:hypothetical protein